MEGNKTTFIYDHFWAHDQKLPDFVQTQLQTWFFAINLQDNKPHLPDVPFTLSCTILTSLVFLLLSEDKKRY